MFLQMTGLDDRDIVFVRYVNEAKDRHCLPYFIAVDKSTSSVGGFNSQLELHMTFSIKLLPPESEESNDFQVPR